MWLKSINCNCTGVQASGVIIAYCDSAVSYGPKIIGPHSSGNFNDCLFLSFFLQIQQRNNLTPWQQRNNLTPAVAERNQIVDSKENASRQMLSTKPQ